MHKHKIVFLHLSLIPMLMCVIGLSVPSAAFAQAPVEVEDDATILPPPLLPELPSEAQSTADEPDVFFDAEDEGNISPQGELARKGAPSKVDPRVKPATRVIITETNHKANSREARIVAAERAVALGRFESALDIYDQLLDRNKRDPEVLFGRAVALQKLGYVDEAIRAYEKLLDITPDNREARINVQGIMATKYPSVALRNLKEIYAQNPTDVSVIAQLSVVEAKLRNYPEALRYLGMAAGMEPKNAVHVFNMAVIADRIGEKKRAIEYYEKALEVDSLYCGGHSIQRDAVFERLAYLR